MKKGGRQPSFWFWCRRAIFETALYGISAFHGFLQIGVQRVKELVRGQERLVL